MQDSVIVPIYRQLFHDKINDEQLLLDKMDGTIDGLLKVSAKPDINLAVSDAILRKVNVLEDIVEKDIRIKTNNEKIRNLGYIENLLKGFRSAWKSKAVNPLYAPLLVETFENILNANIEGRSMAAFIEKAPYPVGKILGDIFVENSGYEATKKILYLKFCKLNPDDKPQYQPGGKGSGSAKPNT